MIEKKMLTVSENNVIYKDLKAEEIVITGENVTLENCIASCVKVEAERFVARACEFTSLALTGAENALIAQSKLETQQKT